VLVKLLPGGDIDDQQYMLGAVFAGGIWKLVRKEPELDV